MEQENKKNGNGIVIALLALVVVLVAAVGVLSVFLMKSNKDNKSELNKIASEMSEVKASAKELAEKTEEKKDDETGKDDNEELMSAVKELQEFAELMRKRLDEESGDDMAQENDVPISGGYVIRSTEQISDAYKSGDDSALSDDDKKCLKLAKAVLDEIITDGMTDFEKEKAVFEWISKNVRHDDGVTIAIPTASRSVDTPYGVLSGRKAVCVGFATTFRLFMQMMDIDCKVVHNTSRVHSWDLVKIEDDWYHVDLYSDLFNMNDAEALEGHDWNSEYFPAATGYKYTNAYQVSVDFESLEKAAESFYELLNTGKTGAIGFRLTGDKAYTNYYLLNEMAERVTGYLNASELQDSSYIEYNIYQMTDDLMVFYVKFNVWTEEEDDPGMTDPDFEGNYPSDQEFLNADQAIENAFAGFYTKHEKREPYYNGDYEYNFVG